MTQFSTCFFSFFVMVFACNTGFVFSENTIPQADEETISLFDPAQTARQIIDSNTFLSLATSNRKETWIAPVFYAHDDFHTLYFVSSKDSVHVQHIFQNPQVAVSIFDSTQSEGNIKGGINGVQIRGFASLVDKSQYEHVIGLFLKKIFPNDLEKQSAIDPNRYEGTPRLIFQIHVDEIYVQDPDHWKNHRIDRRIKVHSIRN